VQAVSDCAITDAEAGRACTPKDPITPAKKVGLQAGDRIESFNRTPVKSWDQLTSLIRDNGSRKATIVYDRDGAERTGTVATSVLARASVTDPTKTVNVGFLGVTSTTAYVRQSPVYVARIMGDYVKGTVSAIIHLPQRMVDVTKAAFGGERDANGPISVVGASRVAGEMVTLDDPSWAERAQRVLLLLAGLNLFLALFNFVPLLPLDGGHIAGALWEPVRRGLAKMRGRPDPGYVDVARMLPIAYGVGALLMLMSVILIYADIVNPVKLT
jgi:membrane-associated protease RseP (regulator of RpoE activity)